MKREALSKGPTLTPWTSPFMGLRESMDRLFDEWLDDWQPFRPLKLGSNGVRFVPRIDLSETDKALVVTAELPGMEEKDIEVSLTENRLTLKGEKTTEKDTTEKDFHRRERYYGSFQRSILLPCEVDKTAIAANFKNGVLTVRLPKTERVQAETHRIPIKHI